MIHRCARMVLPLEDEAPTVMVGDLRRFVAEIQGAPDGTDVRVERELYDGTLADVFECEWIVE